MNPQKSANDLVIAVNECNILRGNEKEYVDFAHYLDHLIKQISSWVDSHRGSMTDETLEFYHALVGTYKSKYDTKIVNRSMSEICQDLNAYRSMLVTPMLSLSAPPNMSALASSKYNELNNTMKARDTFIFPSDTCMSRALNEIMSQRIDRFACVFVEILTEIIVCLIDVGVKMDAHLLS